MGFAHPDHWLAQLTSEQVTECLAYDTLEPYGGFEATYMMAQICATLINVVASAVGGKNSHRKMLTPVDFIPEWGVEADVIEEKTEEQAVKEMKNILLSLANTKGIPNKKKRLKK